MGPLPAPVTVFASPRTTEVGGDAGAVPAVLRLELVVRAARRRAPSAGTPSGRPPTCAGLISVPLSSVMAWMVLENSICSRRGRSKPCSDLHDVGDAALARLAVDADHRLVGAPHVLGVDGEIGDLPHRVVPGQGLHALLDRVLMGARGRRCRRGRPRRDGAGARAGGCSTRRPGGGRRSRRCRAPGRSPGRRGSWPG